MAMTYLNFTENSLNLNKFKKNPKNSNLKSFCAFLLSILIYISVFYSFKISPSTHLFGTKFWFFILNTIIVIVAADFDSFSSSKEHDFYQDYAQNSTRLTRDYVKIVEPTMPVAVTDQNNELIEEKPKEKIIYVEDSAAADNQNRHEFEGTEHEIHITKEEEEDHAENPDEKCEGKKLELSSNDTQVENLGIPEENKREEIELGQSYTEKEINFVSENEEQLVLQENERQEESRFEENEFSNMPVEELNRRVEEFIRKINREIRLQAAMTGQNLDLQQIT